MKLRRCLLSLSVSEDGRLEEDVWKGLKLCLSEVSVGGRRLEI